MDVRMEFGGPFLINLDVTPRCKASHSQSHRLNNNLNVPPT
jgi:hypothetical protein